MGRALPLFLIALGLLGAAGRAEADHLASVVGLVSPDRLSDARPLVRAHAARALGLYGPREATTERLVQAYATESDADVRSAILEALAMRAEGGATAMLTAELRAPRIDHVGGVTRALAAIGTQQALAALVEALARPETAAAAQAALASAGPRVTPLLLEAIRSAPLRPGAVRALSAVGDSRVVPPLMELLRVERSAPARRVLAEGLGALGDERAAALLAGLIRDQDESVAVASLDALGRVGQRRHASAVHDMLEDPRPLVRRAALLALGRLDADAALAACTEVLVRGDATLGAVALDVALEQTDPAAIPLLEGIARGPSRAHDAVSSLAQVEAGAGIPTLIGLAGEPAVAWHVARELAVALRQFGGDVGSSERAQALAVIERVNAEDVARSLILRAVARDGASLEPMLARLGDDSAAGRALAALGLELLGDPAARDALVARLAVESDPEALRRIAAAALALGARATLQVADHAFGFADARAEVVALLAASARRGDADERRKVRRLVLLATRSADARDRAWAAHSIALGAVAGGARILASMLDDPLAEVRLAVARALAVLGTGEVGARVIARARIEEDGRVRRALLDAASPGRRAPDASGRAGAEVLRASVRAPGRQVLADVLFDDGRWWRGKTLVGGEIILGDLPVGTAELRLVPETP